MDGLAMLAQQVLAEDPFSGALFAFRGKRGGLIKLLWFDGQGLCLFSKRLEKGHFQWPVTDTGRVSLTPAQLSMLLEGITGVCLPASAVRNWQANAAVHARFIRHDS
jgi:transposase